MDEVTFDFMDAAAPGCAVIYPYEDSVRQSIVKPALLVCMKPALLVCIGPLDMKGEGGLKAPADDSAIIACHSVFDNLMNSFTYERRGYHQIFTPSDNSHHSSFVMNRTRTGS